MKSALLGVFLAIGLVDANAGFVSATWDVAGNASQKSFVTLQAIGASQGSETFDSFLFPSVTHLSNGSVSEKAQIEATLDFSPEKLDIDFTTLERRDRDTYTSANGAFVFSVSDTVKTIASGNLNLLSAGIPTENALWARLFDYTTQEFLLQSGQYDNGYDKNYVLGGIVGNRGASFSGSLENTLIAGHIYRFDYLLGSGKNGSGDFGSSAKGGFSLVAVTAVPEPKTYAMMLLGLSVMGAITRRRKATHTS